MKLRKLTQSLLRHRYFNHRIILAGDLLLSVLASLFTMTVLMLLFEEVYTAKQFGISIPLSLCASFFSFWLLRIYRGVIRHSGLVESFRILCAALFKVVFQILFAWALGYGDNMKIILVGCGIDFFLTFFLLLTVRSLMIIAYNWLQSQVVERNSGNHLFIYVNKECPTPLSQAMIQQLNEKYSVDGYLRIGAQDDLRIGGLRLYSVNSTEEMETLMVNRGIKAVLFLQRADVETERERLVRFCERTHTRMLLLPQPDEIPGGKINFRSLPEVRIEDLLGRAEIRINMENIKNELQGKTILVTGAAGSIGSEICRQLCTFGLKELVLLDVAETPMHNIRLELEDTYPQVKFTPIVGDIRVAPRMRWIMQTYRPQVVFHAAAYKHVPLMEENPCEAVLTNVVGTRMMADLSVEFGVERFVMVSTDKAVNPTNVMGASKRLAEIYVQTLSMSIAKGETQGKTKFITTRFGNVLGSNGSVIPRFREQLAKGGPLTVTHPEIIRYFMTIPEAVRLVLEAGVMGEGNEIFVFDMGEPVKIADLARRMIQLAGLEPDKDVMIKYTGLRPGEKLYEELLATKENTLPTPNKKIFRAHVREYDRATVVQGIDHLKVIAETVDRMETVKCMKEIVPEFKSKNSVFEKLDK